MGRFDGARQWMAHQSADGEGEKGLRQGEKAPQLSEQFLVLITCWDERQQVELLGRFQAEGLE